MATMQHVIRVNGIVCNIREKTHKGYMLDFCDTSYRLIIDGQKHGRLLFRAEGNGRMVKTPVKLD